MDFDGEGIDMRLGDIEIKSILENSFHLDGGSMFGVIPKIIWNKMAPSDENNLIQLDINPLLIISGKEKIIVDTGFGDVLNEKQKKIYLKPLIKLKIIWSWLLKNTRIKKSEGKKRRKNWGPWSRNKAGLSPEDIFA